MKRIIYAVVTLTLIISLLVFYLLSSCPSGQTSEHVLNLYGVDPLTLDPTVGSDATSHGYIRQLFSGLLRLDDKLEPAPDIAWRWDLSNDSKTYTFYLRDNVFFHNGRIVKAEDIKYSWEHALNPTTGSQTAATYLGDIVGANEVLAGESQEISGFRVIDDYTISVTIDEPKSYFLSKLTYVATFVVDRDNIAQGNEWWRHPNGTGPFKLRQWDESSQLVLERNELYYNDLAGVELVIFHLWAGVPMNMYETGQIDISQVDLAYVDKINDKAGSFYQDLVVVPELSFYYIGFNTTKPPFDDASIRRAFSQTVDKDKLASLVFKDMVQPADGILPPGMPGFNKDLSGLDFDVDGAKALIATSSYGDVSNLPPITITTLGWGGLISQELEAIIYEWRLNLGVEVNVRQLEPQVFLYDLLREKDEMYYMGWVADYPHPQNFLEVLFSGVSEYNYGQYANPEVDALLRIAGIQQDTTLSLEMYQQVEQVLIGDVACIPLWFGQNYVLIKLYVKGYNLNLLGYARLDSVSVEPH